MCIRNPNKRPDTPSLQLRQHREPQAAEGFVHKKKKHFKDMGMHGSKPQKQAQVLLLGLDGSGKTTLLYKLKYNESVITVPTVGFNVETLETDRGSPGLTVWDVGGQKRMRPHWRHHYTDTAGLVFVVDSWDQKRLGEARKELIRVIKSEKAWFWQEQHLNTNTFKCVWMWKNETWAQFVSRKFFTLFFTLYIYIRYSTGPSPNPGLLPLV